MNRINNILSQLSSTSISNNDTSAKSSVYTNSITSYTSNIKLQNFIVEAIHLLKPKSIYLCNGSQAEYVELTNLMVSTGVLIPLNPNKRPNCFLARSNKSDVARVEERTFICSNKEIDAGHTNKWCDPSKMERDLKLLFNSCMKGRTMYVVPFCMGPLNSELSHVGVEITDSPYVAISMRTMTRMGLGALKMIEQRDFFVPCLHSVGMPLEKDSEDSVWPSNKEKYIVHFPETRRIWSFGSGYGGNALLGKKCLALRIGSVLARDEGWLAEHMLIVGITNPAGVKRYFCGAFPSACGKTNLAMLLPSIPGWKVECVGDDIAWMRVGKDGRLWAINPEAGFFGVAPGTSMQSNPNALLALNRNTIFTNVAMTPDGDVWWEGLTEEKPKKLISWLRTEWTPEMGVPAAQPNSRFAAPVDQSPAIDPDWQNPNGVPISGIIFGGRRSTTSPLVVEARSWEHGVYMGSNIHSETTAAAAGKTGVLRADPFAMRPFCGYNMADYFGHWLSFPQRASNLPKIFNVNWFRKSKVTGKFLWPGFGDNIRALEWMFNRCDANPVASIDTPIGIIPKRESINTNGLKLEANAMDQLFEINKNEWREEVKLYRTFQKELGSRVPKVLLDMTDDLEKRVETL